MNSKRRDFIIGLLLISTLGISAILVSCSDNDEILNAITDRSSHGYHQLGKEEAAASTAIAYTFKYIGQGAAKETGEVAMGWAFGAMGISTASGGNWNAQLALISAELDSIISLLVVADNELASIDSILNVINCTLEETSLQSDLSAIQSSYETYTNLINTASSANDTIPNSDMISFTDIVINGTNAVPPLVDALNDIQININEQSGVIVACMQPIPAPASGTIAADTLYYQQVQALLNKYYYYQVIALGLISEAYHYKAWLDAGSPGGQNINADSVQLVCDENSQTNIDCNYVIELTNSTYNSLLTQFQYVGDGYTDSTKIYQKNSSGQSIVYARSLEDFSQESNANCSYPLNSSNVCGPAAGLYNQSLSSTTYSGTQNFHFISADIMQNDLLGDISTIETFSTIGDYLESLGFYNMSGKILITDTLVKINENKLDTMHVVPFTFTDMAVFKDCSNNKHSMFFTDADFCYLMSNYNKKNNGGCDGVYGTAYEYKFSTTNSPSSAGSWFNLNGNSIYCSSTMNDDYWIQPVIWNSTSTSDAPGWCYYLQNANPQKGFLLPVKTDFAGTDGCLSGYSNFNSGGAITKCGQDYQSYLSVNLPKPPTCSIANVSPPCNN